MLGTRSGDDSVMRFALAGLVMAAITNAVVAVSEAVAWAWWVAGGCSAAASVFGAIWVVRRNRAPEVEPDDADEEQRKAGTAVGT